MRANPAVNTLARVMIGIILLAGISPAMALNMQPQDLVIHPELNSSDLEIQRALDQLPAAGGIVTLTPGIFAIHHPIRLSRSGLTLRGSGDATVLRLADRADCPVIIMGSVSATPPQTVNDLRVADLLIDGNRSHQLVEAWPDPENTSGIQNNGIMVQAVSNSVVEEVTAAHCRSGGLVTANGTRHLTVTGFTSYDNQFDGLACYRTEDSVFRKLNLYDNQCAGISLDLDFNHNLITDSTLTRNDLGIFMRRSFDNRFQNIRISQSRHDGVFMAQWGGFSSAHGWEVVPQTECSGNRFSGLEVRDCAGVAFCVHDAACVDNTITDALFSGNLNNGAVEAGATLDRVPDLLKRKTGVE